MYPATAEQEQISPQDYIEGEQYSQIRHEYIDGEVYAMAGGSDAHAKISLNTAMLLKQYLRGSSCDTYISDMKAQIDQTKYFYPDVMVTCDSNDAKRNYSKQQPILIIEVLSTSTEAYDRGKKFEYYRQIEALKEYVLIDQTSYHVDIFRKNAKQRWELFSFSDKNETISFASMDYSFKLSELYEDVDFTLL